MGKEFGHCGLAASSRVFVHEAALLGLVYCLVGGGKDLCIALFGVACNLKRLAQAFAAGVVKHLFAQALTICFFGRLGNCHARIVLYIGMIGKLTGQLSPLGDGSVLVETGGVGYVVRVPLSVLAEHKAGVVSLYVHTAVREDALDLYGFLSQEELLFFKLLTSVSGVGPKTALGVLNVADVVSLKRAIAGGDPSSLTRVFGIGKKSAERIVVELRDKLIGEKSSPSTGLGVNDADVIEALMSLGYRADESRAALKEIPQEAAGTHARLSAALRYLGGARV